MSLDVASYPMNDPVAPAMKQLVVFKLGGSVLELPGLAESVRALRQSRRLATVLLVVGGGRAADAVRDWDRMHNLGADAAHLLALEAMALNEALVARLLPEACLVRSSRQIPTGETAAPGIVCAACFCRWAESVGHPPLPHSWNVTSDSIAAWCARILDADELVLVKSVPLPARMTAEQAASQGLVDPCFPGLAQEIPRVGWVNVRSAAPAIETWQLTGG